MKKILLGLYCLLWCLPAMALEGWEGVAKSREPGEVKTWVRSVEGAQVKEFRGEVDVPHPPLQVLKTLDHVEGFPQWVFRCKHSERIEGVGVYLQIHGVWPVSDRDAALRSRVEVLSDRVVVRTDAEPDLRPQQKGHVRIPFLKNSFDVIPLPDGGSRIVFQTFVDPGGILPSWLSNMVAKQGPLETLTDMKKVLGPVQPNQTTDGLSPIYIPVHDALLELLTRTGAGPKS